jgi:hypothetical protein
MLVVEVAELVVGDDALRDVGADADDLGAEHGPP